MIHACTIVARNYLAQAQVLVDSFREHHPDGTFAVLLVDEPDTARPVVRGAEVVMVDEIGVLPADLFRMTMSYELIELATALKPWLLTSLLDRGFDHAVYFDPDISIERRIEELPQMARESSIVLTPHLTEPMPQDGGHPDEQALLLSGTYNLGFIGVGNTDEARRMLAWWSERLLTSAYVDVEHGFFTDQRSIDFVPGLFQHVLVKDPSWNIAYWNMSTRRLERTETGAITVAGHPLTFVHYSGYSPLKPHLLSKHQGPKPRLLLSEQPILRELCDDYGRRLLAEGFAERQTAFVRPFAVLDGVQLDRSARALIRKELRRRRDDGLPPSTLRFGSDAGVPLEQWLDEPADDGVLPFLGRYLREPYQRRLDLQAAYPEVVQGQIDNYLEWCKVHGTVEEDLSLDRIRAARRSAKRRMAAGSPDFSRPAEPVRDTTAVHGLEMAGYFTAELGLGESARQFARSAELAGLPLSTTTWSRTLSRRDVAWEDREPAEGERYDTALVCVNADMLSLFVEGVGPRYLRRRYRIGLWFWELDDFPVAMQRSIRLLDEVWVCSEFNAAAIRRHTDKPVVVLPHPAHAPAESTERVPELPDDGTYTFLYVFDYLSVYERKNPAGLVEAYLRAFPEPGQARLVIKSINGQRRLQEREQLLYLTAGRPDIVLIERYLSRDELDSLMWSADCYVSLHRSEGFGQTLAEMMAIGKPVIATRYSGSLEYTAPGNSFLVDHTMTKVPTGSEPYPTTSTWADPDLDQAAGYMRALQADPATGAAVAAAGARTIAQDFSNEALARAMRSRLEKIWASEQFERRTGSAQRPAAKRGAWARRGS